MLKILTVIGTRPEAVKMAPVIHELKLHSNKIRSIICSTGQHNEMLKDIFNVFGIKPDCELAVMKPDQSLSLLTARLLESVDKAINETKPDWILAQGDTTTVMVAALLTYYHKICFGHVEAGLRTGSKYSPHPEEINRIIADDVAELMFAPTSLSQQRLLKAGAKQEQVILTGNTVIDALYAAADMPYSWDNSPLSTVPQDKTIVLVTAHRRESFGKPIKDICNAVKTLAERFENQNIQFVYPVHLNPNIFKPAQKILGKVTNVSLLPPLDYLSLVNLLKKATLVMTDSGGIQEEAPAFGKPVLVMRNHTERPEGVTEGVCRLVGTSMEEIIDAVTQLLTDQDAYGLMATRVSPYGDGKAAKRIVKAILDYHQSVA
jgi:UDP-N-acetylglucosamine 2-epimerase (non-hydrolysing)